MGIQELALNSFGLLKKRKLDADKVVPKTKEKVDIAALSADLFALSREAYGVVTIDQHLRADGKTEDIPHTYRDIRLLPDGSFLLGQTEGKEVTHTKDDLRSYDVAVQFWLDSEGNMTKVIVKRPDGTVRNKCPGEPHCQNEFAFVAQVAADFKQHIYVPVGNTTR